jgi:hypothetical protein
MFTKLLDLSKALETVELKKGIVSNDNAGIDLNTAEQSQDELAAGNNEYLAKIRDLMDFFHPGDAPRDLTLPNHLVLKLQKDDDGFFTGFVVKDDPMAGNHGEILVQLLKLTPEAIVQALKTKGYLPQAPVEVVPATEEQVNTALAEVMADPLIVHTLANLKGDLHIHLGKSENKYMDLLKALQNPK